MSAYVLKRLLVSVMKHKFMAMMLLLQQEEEVPSGLKNCVQSMISCISRELLI